jgi:hypothetical protein
MDIHSLFKGGVWFDPQKGVFNGLMSRLWGWEIEAMSHWNFNKEVGMMAMHKVCGYWEE